MPVRRDAEGRITGWFVYGPEDERELEALSDEDLRQAPAPAEFLRAIKEGRSSGHDQPPHRR